MMMSYKGIREPLYHKSLFGVIEIWIEPVLPDRGNNIPGNFDIQIFSHANLNPSHHCNFHIYNTSLGVLVPYCLYVPYNTTRPRAYLF